MIFAGVLVASVAVATISVDRIENRTVESLEPILIASGESWASIVPDGVLIRITGEAPDEAASQRLAALIGNVVSPERIVNDSTFKPRDAQSELEASTFIVSALRDGDRVSLGGLVGTDDHRQIIHDAVRASVTDATINDLMIDVGEPAFVYSSEALQFGLASLALLPGSSVTIEADRVTITAALPSEDELAKVKGLLSGRIPDGVQTTLNLRAPVTSAPVFEFRATRSDENMTVARCTAASTDDARRILSAIERIEAMDASGCQIALGSPHPEWADVVIASVEAMTAHEAQLLRISNADILFVIDEDSSREEDVKAALQDSLPDLFSLRIVHSLVDDANMAEGDTVPGHVQVTLNEDRTVVLEGAIHDDRSSEMIRTYAEILFGKGNVENRIGVDGQLPGGWPVAVFSGLEALELLQSGTLEVTEDGISVSGTGLQEDASTQVARMLATQARDWGEHLVSVTYTEVVEEEDPKLDLQESKECEDRISSILAKDQIVFSPGKTNIEPESAKVIDAIAEVLAECPGVSFEVEGHTDSSGNSETNRNLSLLRAEFVIGALIERGIITSGLSAKGYGEEFPIASNSTAEGKRKNRRIAFRLLTQADGEIEEAPGTEQDE